jgi:redox-sensitive bicupin YhaK (pirin superfamily)
MICRNMNVAVYVYRGAALFGTNEKRVEKDHLVLFEADGDGVAVKVDADDGAKFLLLAGTFHTTVGCWLVGWKCAYVYVCVQVCR